MGVSKRVGKGVIERSFKAHTERSNQNIASDEASKVVWRKGSYGRASRMKFQKCLPNDFPKQSSRGDVLQKRFEKSLIKEVRKQRMPVVGVVRCEVVWCGVLWVGRVVGLVRRVGMWVGGVGW